MRSEVIPETDFDNRNHKYIWDSLAHKLTDDDFTAIQLALIEREDEHEQIDKCNRMFIPFGGGRTGMYQPRPLPEYVKREAHRYIDWECAETIWMILSKYADFYSKF